MLEVLYYHAKFGGARALHTAGAAKNVELLSCHAVCQFVRLAFK